MCIIAAKYFKDTGWILAKNRDQNYVADTTILDKIDPNVGEILLLDDKTIKYQEGMNHKGLVIITTSLTPIISQETNDNDGNIIKAALKLADPEAAAKYVIEKKLTGFIFIGTPEKLIVVEAARDRNGRGEYHATSNVIPQNELIVRTNHGVEYPWAGFQMGISAIQDMWTKSSKTRQIIAERVLKNAKTPEEMLDGLAKREVDNLQMNVFRVESTPSQMRTIFQWALVPKTSTVYLRPIQSKMNVRVSPDKIKIVVMDNEPIKQVYKDVIKHFCKIVSSGEDGHIKTVETEQFLYFRDYINQPFLR
jgi:DNA-binding beta-propeller fold protein YncE